MPNHLQPLVEHPHVRHVVELDRVGVRAGVVTVDAVDPSVRALQHHFGFDLHAAERRSGVGREERVAVAPAEDDDVDLPVAGQGGGVEDEALGAAVAAGAGAADADVEELAVCIVDVRK